MNKKIFDAFVDLIHNFMLVSMIFEFVLYCVSAKLLKLLYQFFLTVVTKTDYLETSLSILTVCKNKMSLSGFSHHWFVSTTHVISLSLISRWFLLISY